MDSAKIKSRKENRNNLTRNESKLFGKNMYMSIKDNKDENLNVSVNSGPVRIFPMIKNETLDGKNMNALINKSTIDSN